MFNHLFLILVPFAVGTEYESNESVERGARRSFDLGLEERNNDVKARQHFRFAAIAYAGLHRRGIDNPALSMNEGNALLLAGDLPAAILAYRRGLQLDADDAELRQALSYARSQVAFATDEDRRQLTPAPESFQTVKYVLRRWGLVATGVMAVLGWIALIRWAMLRNLPTLVLGVSCLAAAIALTGARFVESQIRLGGEDLPVAVTVRSTTLRKGDGPSFPPRRESPLPAGVEAKVRGESGAWIHVELADGTLGWLPREQVYRH